LRQGIDPQGERDDQGQGFDPMRLLDKYTTDKEKGAFKKAKTRGGNKDALYY